MAAPATPRRWPASLDPEARALLEALPARDISKMTPNEARTLPLVLTAAPEPVGAVAQQWIDGPGGRLALRIYRPAGAGPFRALVWMHGGGWVTGSLDGTDRTCRALTRLAECVVISVDYRLAPEAKFPGAVEDVDTAVRWVAASAASIGVDAARIAVGGFSAGGNLAAAAAKVARDRGTPRVAFQLLVNPVIDHRFDTPSYDECEDGPITSRDDMRWFWAHYLRDPSDGDDPLASVSRGDLRGMPPALVITAGCDPLRDEGEAYAAKLRAAGVEATASRYEGMPHGFMGLPSLPDARRVMDEIAAELRRRLS